MAYLGFAHQLIHNNGLKNTMNEVKEHSLKTAEWYGKSYGAVSGVYEQGMANLESNAAAALKESGHPNTPENLEVVRNAIADSHASKAIGRMDRLNSAYEKIRDKDISKAQAAAQNLGLDANDAAAFAQQSWDLSLPSRGIGDVFRQTASDRATALNITRFRATDGSMDTLNSLRSLMYKDDLHLSNAGNALTWGGIAMGSYGLLMAGSSARDALSD